MAVPVRVVPRPSGDWLVIAGRRRFAVPADVARQLQAEGRLEALFSEELAAGMAGGSPELPQYPGTARRALWLRIPLLPATQVEAIAQRLVILAGWPGLIVTVLVGLAGYGVASWWPPTAVVANSAVSPLLVGLALMLFLVTAIWHELGHAAALARAGLPPGRIGAGILFVVPVLFADVSAAAVLNRPDRLRVDVAGICFQVAVGGFLVAAGCLVDGWVPDLACSLRWAGWAALLAVVWSALPFIRADGYWVLCDLLDLPDLDRPVTPAAAVAPARFRWLLPAIIFFRVLNAGFLGLVGVLVPLRLVGWFGRVLGIYSWPNDPSVRSYLLATLAVFCLVVLWSGLVRQISRLARSSWLDAKMLLDYYRFQNTTTGD